MCMFPAFIGSHETFECITREHVLLTSFTSMHRCVCHGVRVCPDVF